MNTYQAFELALAQGVVLYAEDGKLKFKAPAGGMTDELRAALKEHRESLLTVLGNLKQSPASLPPIEPLQQTSTSLSFAQQRLWFLDQLRGPSAEYNIPQALLIRGPLQTPLMAEVFNEIIRRHDILRSVYLDTPQGVRQQVLTTAQLTIQLEDLTAASDTKRDALLQDLIRQHASQPFDLQSELPIRVCYILLSPQQSDAPQQGVLLLNMHHIASDGWSMAVLVKEFVELYQAGMTGKTAALAPLPVQYSDYAIWQRAYLQGEVLAQQLNYWREQLAGVPVLHSLPLDKARPKQQSFAGGTVQSQLDSGLTQQLKALCQREGATLFMGLHAAFSALLSRYSNESDIVVGSPMANREQPEVAGLIGFFVNTLVLRSQVSSQASLQDLIQQSRQTCLGAYAHQQVPFEKLVEVLQVERSLSHSPLFQLMLVLQNNEQTELALPGLTLSAAHGLEEIAKFDLTLSVTETADGLELNWNYSSDIFARASIERLAGHFNRLIAEALTAPTKAVHALPILDAAEIAQLDRWNETAVDYPQDSCIHQLFALQAARTPDAVAVLCGAEQLTYAQLHAKANQLAHYLRHQYQVGPDVLVGLCLERSLEMVIGMMAILKAGAAYVPLDPDYPTERLAFMAEDAQLPVILSMTAQAGLALPAMVLLDDPRLQSDVAGYPVTAPETAGLTATSLAYLIYTSGSTGKPKGVMVEHRALVNRIDWMHRLYGCNASDRILQKTPFSFDVSVWEFVWPLSAGAALVLAKPHGHKDPHYLVSLMNETGVTKLHFVPSMLSSMLSCDVLGQCRSVQQVFCSGEALSAGQVAEFRQQCPTVELHNLYGPTEAAIDVSYWDCRAYADAENQGIVPIGRPIHNIQLYVLNAGMQQCPVGVVGELYIGGVGLARGYLNRPELTAERFVMHPFGTGRLYRTGDLVRWLADGNIEYLGRNDFQLKIRGYRIEAGEIEAVLQRCGAEVALVTGLRDSTGHQVLVAYYQGAGLEAEVLRQRLSASLPAHLVPTHLVQVEQFVLSANGKIDRKALPALDLSQQQAVYEAPQTQTELVLAELWQQLLSVDRVGREDNFFRLGGHSLLLMELASGLKQQGYQTNIQALFTAKSLRQMAEVLEVKAPDAEEVTDGVSLIPAHCTELRPEMVPLVALSSDELSAIAAQVPGGAANIQDIYPLAPLQESIFLIHSLSKTTDPYVICLSLVFDDQAGLDQFVDDVNFVIARHDVLRTAILWRGRNTPVQVVLREASLQTTPLPCAGVAPVASEVEHYLQHGCHRLDLEQAPLLSLEVVQDPQDGKCYAVLKEHHLMLDHVSLAVLLHELSLGKTGRQALATPVPYRAFLARTLRQQATLDTDSFFQALLGSVQTPTLPFQLADVTAGGLNCHELTVELPADMSLQLRALMKQLTASPAVLFHLAWAMVLAACSQTRDVVFGTVLSGRMNGPQGINQMLGLMINTLPVRVCFEDQNATSLLQSTQQQLQALLPYEQVSLAEAQRHSNLSGTQPLFSALLNYRHSSMPADGGRAHGHTTAVLERTNYPFNLSVDDWQQQFSLHFVIDRSIDTAQIAGYMLTALAQLMAALANNSTQPVATMSVLPVAEQQRLLLPQSLPSFASDPQLTIHQRFEQQAAAQPDQIALICGEVRLSYRELNEQANRLAHYLRQHYPMAPDQRIGLCVGRSVDLLTGILAILKAGAAYVPLDPGYPAERLAFIIEDAALSVVLTEREFQAIAGTESTLVVLDDPALQTSLALLPECNLAPLPGSSSAQLAYVIYTSGSTGLPKGVLQTHHNVIRLFDSTADDFGFAANDCWCLFHSFAFDFSVWEMWGALFYGGRLFIPQRQEVTDPALFVRVCQREGLTVLNQTPSAFRQLTEYLLQSQQQLSTLRYVVFGGEGLTDSHLALWWQHFSSQPTQLINMYGITETTVHVTYQPLQPAAPISIGRPLRDQFILLLDASMQLVPYGCAGEIYVGGAGLAQGYLNRDELTAERFVTNPFYLQSPWLGPRLYKAGDLARYNQAGQLEYLGRQDDQVKIRGHRIELGEVEARIAQCSGIDSTVVLAVAAADGQLQLIAYAKAAAASDTPQGWGSQIRRQLQAVLPAYMVPAAVIQVTQWPLTSNGKVDKKALPAFSLDQLDTAYAAPERRVEEQLLQIWSQLLGLPLSEISIDAHFFELGGHSLLLIRLLASIRQQLAVELSVSDVFSAGTIRLQADRILQSEQALPVPALQVVTRSVDGWYPLSFAQQRLWLIDQLNEGSAEYNIQQVFLVDGVLETAKLEQALTLLVARHEVLRTVYADHGQGPQQHIRAVQPVRLQYHDLTAVPLPRQQQALADWLAADCARPFRLEADLMLRASYIALEQTGDGAVKRAALSFCIHHIATDGWSMEIMAADFVRCYQIVCAQTDIAPWPELAVQYLDYAHWQRGQQQEERLARQLGYWQQQLAGLPLLHGLQPDQPRPEYKQFAAKVLRTSLPQPLAKQIAALAARSQLTPFMLVHAALALVLTRHCNQTDIVVGTPVANRHLAVLEPVMGFFVNTLVLRLQTADCSLATYLAQVRRVHAAALSHQELPFEQLVEALQVERSAAYSPLFQILLTMDQGFTQRSEGDLAIDNVQLTPYQQTTALSPFDLEIDVNWGEQEVELRWVYDLALFSEARIALLGQHLQMALTGIIEVADADLQRPLSQIGLLSDAERTQQLLSWNDTARAFDSERCIHHWFEAQVALTPTAVAVECEGQSLSYAQLNARANQLAHYLKTVHGVGVDVLVGLCMERSLEMVIGLWAILKAGGAYVPLDPAYPAQRLAYLREDASVQVVLSQLSVMAQLGLSDAVVVSQQAWGFADWPVHNVVDDAAHAGQLAYVIYTSGSTGQPKGVLNHHRALANRVEWMHNAYGRTAGDVVLQKTPYSFDVSVWEFVWPLVTGSRLVLARPEGHKEPAYLAEVIQAQGVSQLHFVPSMLGLMLEHGGLRDCKSVRQVFCSGEALQVGHVAAFKAQMPWAELHNLYGPTEAAIDVSYWDCRNDCGTSVPIGKPIQNISLYILDEHQQLLPVGAAGELYIGGIGLARGYLNRPELTAERFVANPYYVPGSPNSSERLYRTGDLARYRSDGNIEYLGRLDFQVKLRGFRIELGEIEAALGQLAGIDSALVVAHGTGERQQLVGYYKANSAGHAGQLALKAQLQQKLPEHMVPAVLIEVQEWPLNANGKVDRKALPPVTVQASGGYQAPAGATEQLLAGIWSEVLGIPLAHISATASFFELGGHSLLLLRLLKAIEQQAGHRLTVKTVFKHHSVQLQGAYIDRLQASRALSEKLEKTNNLERMVF